MQLHEFLGRIQQHAQLNSREDALGATRATLETLSERIQGGEPKDLASQLPQLLKDFVHEGEGERFGTDEFFRRVADREGVDESEGRRHAQAVLRTIREAVDSGEMKDVMAQLPQEYRALFSNTRGRPS